MEWNQISCTLCGGYFEEDAPEMVWSEGESPLPFCSVSCREQWSVGEKS